jgi:hypothetical protein
VIHDKWEYDILYFQGDHVPFFPPVFWWYEWGGGVADPSPSTIAQDIQWEMSQLDPPAFAVIWGSGLQRPSTAKAVRDLLDPSLFSFCRMDEMTALADQIDHFHDVGTKYWAYDAVEACFDAGIVQGYSETHYRPTRPVNRGQMAVFVARGLAGGDAGVPDFAGTPTFPDVEEEHWALDYVEYVVSQNIVGGYLDGTYQPTNEVTRDQMSVYVARSMVAPTTSVLDSYVPADPRNFPDVLSDHWAYTYVEYCVEQAVVGGYLDGYYHPERVVTRDQMAVYVSRAFGL